MTVKIKVQMTTKIMYDFLLFHNYTSVHGLVGIALGLGVIGLFIFNPGEVQESIRLIYLVFGIFFLIYLPLSLYMKAKKQVILTPMFKKPLEYIMSDTGITILQEDAQAEIKWEELLKIRESRKSIIIYAAKNRALILPLDSIKGQHDSVSRLINEHMKPERIKLRKK